MTVWAVLLAFIGALNPFRRRRCLSVPDGRQVVAGASAALVAYALLAVVGASLRDALDVSTPNMRIAAGLVLVVVGLHAVVAPLPAPPAMVHGRAGWLAPVLFPALFRPDLALIAFAADRASGVLVVVVAAALALVALAAWWFALSPSSRSATTGVAQRDLDQGTGLPSDEGGPARGEWERPLGAVAGVVTVAAAVRLLLDGVFAL